MAKNKPTTDFNAHAASVIQNAEQPAQAPEAPARGKVTTFEIDPGLDRQLARVAFWGGPDETRRNVINSALAYYFQNHPEAKQQANTPVPREK